MANQMYPEAKDDLLMGDLDLLVDDIRVILIDVADYTFSSLHDFLDDVAAGARVAVSGSLTGKTAVNGLFSATVPTISGVSGDPCEAIIVYKHTGVESTSRLIAYIDTESDGTTAISFTPNGSDVDVSLPNGVIQI